MPECLKSHATGIRRPSPRVCREREISRLALVFGEADWLPQVTAEGSGDRVKRQVERETSLSDPRGEKRTACQSTHLVGPKLSR